MTRSVRTTPSERSLWAVRRPASVWSTGPTCWLTLAAPLPSGIHCSQRRISMVSWRPWLQRSNVLHQPANALTQKIQPLHLLCMKPMTKLMTPRHETCSAKKRRLRISAHSWLSRKKLFLSITFHTFSVCWEGWCWVVGWLVHWWLNFLVFLSLKKLRRNWFLGCWHWTRVLEKTMLEIKL